MTRSFPQRYGLHQDVPHPVWRQLHHGPFRQRLSSQIEPSDKMDPMKRPTKRETPSRPAEDPERATKSGRLNVAELKKALKAAQDAQAKSDSKKN